MVWMRCQNGPREQASNTVALDEKNRAKLVKDEPARTEEDQLGEEKTGSRDLVKLDAYERDGGKRIVEKNSCGERRNQLGNKLRAQQCLSVMNKPARCKETSWLSSNEPGKKSSGQEHERIKQEQLYTIADDKSKLEISLRAVASKSSRIEEATSSSCASRKFSHYVAAGVQADSELRYELMH
ncbi:hypothetical protein F511_30554 [Dorcoceras hygrometricum]|uniref:Uncharacterized protein n=1 Tax=Dorcoceras hygrometricum TaxID=472368 RepID=A0A2Z7BTC7_9LAMI|nr:hypothetical protein F511_30554 [Dorcoceras hygrometricum]